MTGTIDIFQIDRIPEMEASHGRNAGYPAPSAQTRTCGFLASYVVHHIRCVMWRRILC